MYRLDRARAALGLLVGLLFAGLMVAPAAAADGAFLRLAHFSPDTPSVDVYVTNAADPADTIVLTGVGYGAVSDYQTVAGGTYTVSMRPAGAEASTPPVISTTLTTAAGKAYTVAGVGSFDSLGLTVLDDDLTLPPAGQARVRVVQAAASEPELDISVDGGPSLGDDIAFATTTGYSTVEAGEWTLRLAGTAGLATTLPLEVVSGGVYSVLVLDDAAGGLTVVTQTDAAAAAGPSGAPVGGVETGAGGTASLVGVGSAQGSGGVPIGAAWVAGLLGVAAIGAIRRRRGRAALTMNG